MLDIINLECPRAYYCDEDSIDPIPCPPGSFGYLLGRINVTECKLCPATTYNEYHGQSSCTLCETGSYSVTVGATSPNTCVPCSSGSFCPAPNVTLPCYFDSRCEIGSHSISNLKGSGNVV